MSVSSNTLLCDVTWRGTEGEVACPDSTTRCTGAAFGIGRATAVRFAQEGARLVVTDIQEGPLLALADELRGSGAEVEAVAGDV